MLHACARQCVSVLYFMPTSKGKPLMTVASMRDQAFLQRSKPNNHFTNFKDTRYRLETRAQEGEGVRRGEGECSEKHRDTGAVRGRGEREPGSVFNKASA